MIYTLLEFADKFSDLVVDQSNWSQETFGSDKERGPVGALKHLEKEAVEARKAVDTPGFREEIADCFLLVLDAARRAGIKPMQLVEEAQKKMEINKEREWPKPVADEPVEHVKEDPRIS